MNEYTEKTVTSTQDGLIENPELLLDIQKGRWYPQSIQFAPTDVCNLNCSFCSVKNRAGDELDFKDSLRALAIFKDMGAKTVELTGGGDPTMYPKINDLIEACYYMGYKIGMITNGVILRKKVTQENLDRLTWLRISLNSLDQVPEVDIPPIKGTLGFSYVWNPEGSKEKLEKIKEYKEKYNAKYVRVVPDCRSPERITECKKEIAPLIKDFEGFFLQTKDYNAPKRCWIGYIKPFVAPDGYIYPCSAIPLQELKFPERYRMGHINDDIRGIWKNITPRHTDDCSTCFFKGHNEIIDIVKRKSIHRDFI